MNNRGIALVTGLILLAALAMLALLAASGTILQRNMAINYQQNAVAIQNASIASGYAAAWLTSRPVTERQSGCATGCVLPPGIRNSGEFPPQPEFESSAWWRSNAIAVGYNPETAETSPTPDSGLETARWLIEEIHYEPTGEPRGPLQAEGVAYYRVLSRGTGQNPRSVAVIESLIARPWEGDFQVSAYPPAGPVNAFCRQFNERYACGILAWRQRR